MLNREKVKIVYIAPMKALAAELVGKFSKSLAPLGLQVSICEYISLCVNPSYHTTHGLTLNPMKALAVELVGKFSR